MSVDRRILTDLAAIERNAQAIERALKEIGERLDANAALLKAYDERAAGSLCTTAQCGLVLRNAQAWGLATVARAAVVWQVFGLQLPGSTPRVAGSLATMARADVERLALAVNALASTFESPPRGVPPEAA